MKTKKKKSFGKRLLLLLLILCLAAGACFAFQTWQRERLRSAAEEEQRQALRLEEEKRRQELAAVEEITAVLDAEGLASLEEYPNLRRLDLSGSEDYEAILSYQRAHPQVELLYTVDLDGTTVWNTESELVLPAGAYSLSTLGEKLAYLPQLRSVGLEELRCAPEELAALRAQYPEKEISYTVRIGETVCEEHTETLDLSWLSPEQTAEAAAGLRLLPDLREAQLCDESGQSLLGPDELRQLQLAKPETLFHYRFQLFDREISTDMERIEWIRVPIGNEGVEQLRQVLPCLTRCSYLLLDDCGIDNEVLARLREDFPETKIVWRVHISYLDFLTDVKIIHLTFLLTNQNAQVMRFCNEVEYLDIGHNSISDITFMGYMPHLKYVILSYNNVSDLSPLAKCQELEMLELYQCLKLEDISPLAACQSLKLLNVSWCEIKDITPVYGLKNLQRFYCIWNYGIPAEQQEEAFRQLPDCWVTFEQNISKNVGWSFDADGGVRAQWYLDMYKILRYRVEHYFFGDYPEGWNREEERFEPVEP